MSQGILTEREVLSTVDLLVLTNLDFPGNTYFGRLSILDLLALTSLVY